MNTGDAAIWQVTRQHEGLAVQSTAMQPDDEICYCYHVSLRKLVNFSVRVRPQQASRMTECLGAGSGCGWCIPFLIKIAQDPEAFRLDHLTPQEYAEHRRQYRSGGQARNAFGQESENTSRIIESEGTAPGNP